MAPTVRALINLLLHRDQICRFFVRNHTYYTRVRYPSRYECVADIVERGAIPQAAACFLMAEALHVCHRLEDAGLYHASLRCDGNLPRLVTLCDLLVLQFMISDFTCVYLVDLNACT